MYSILASFVCEWIVPSTKLKYPFTSVAASILSLTPIVLPFFTNKEKDTLPSATVKLSWTVPPDAKVVNVEAFIVPSGDSEELGVIVASETLHSLVKSSDWSKKLVLCGSSNKIGHPPSVWSIRGTSTPIVSIIPFSFILVASEFLVNVKSPLPFIGLTEATFPTL